MSRRRRMAPELAARDLAGVMARANPKWSRQRGATNECEQASWRFSRALEGDGHETSLVMCEQPPHVAVQVGEVVVDLTARQFDPEAPYPWVTTEAEWREWLGTR